MAKKSKKSIVLVDIFVSDEHNNAPFMGGGQKMLLKFYELLKDKYDISLISSQKFLLEKAQEMGIKVYDVYAPANEVYEKYKSHLKELLKKDVVMINNQASYIEHPNMLYWVHADYFSFCTEKEIKAWTESLKDERVKGAVFVSEPLKKSFESAVPAEKSFVIPNWIEKVYDSPKVYDPDNFRVVWVGTLKPDKNWQELSQALKGEPVDVDFLGEGQDLVFAQEMVEVKPKFFGRQNFLGFVDNPVEYMRERSSVFVFSSVAKYESFGLTLLEAMSVGIPCIAKDSPITRYVLGEGGLYYDTITDLKDIIFRLKADKTLYEEKALYSLERAKLFHKDIVKGRWIELIDTNR